MQLSKIPIVFTFDSSYILPTSISIKSLIDSALANTFYHIYLVSEQLSVAQKALLTAKIDKEQSKYKITWITIDNNIFENVPTNNGWSKSVYFRLLLPKYICEYDKVIYSDTDVLFVGDLSKIYRTNLSGYDWAGVIAESNKNPVCHQHYPQYKNKYIYMSGFMIMNLGKMRNNNKVRTFLKNIQKYSDRLKMFDLEVLNLSCSKIKSISFKYCVLENIYDERNFRRTYEYSWLSRHYSDKELAEARNHPIVIHYAGKAVKVWKRQLYEIKQPYQDYIKIFSNEYRSLNKVTLLRYMISSLPGLSTIVTIVPEKYRLMPKMFMSTTIHHMVMAIPKTTRIKIKNFLLRNKYSRRVVKSFS